VAAPSRKLNEEWQCSSAHGMLPAGRDARRPGACDGGDGQSSAGSPPAGLAAAGWPSARQDIRRWSSRQGTGGLSQPTVVTIPGCPHQ
jgi:hypothetical protein